MIDICYEIDLKHDILIDPHILSESELNSIRGKATNFYKCNSKWNKSMTLDSEDRNRTHKIQNATSR